MLFFFKLPWPKKWELWLSGTPLVVLKAFGQLGFIPEVEKVCQDLQDTQDQR